MSRHEVASFGRKRVFVFGWDQPLQSFYLQVHDKLIDADGPFVVLGADEDSRMYEVEDLVRTARQYDLTIDHDTQVKLFGEKDDGV